MEGAEVDVFHLDRLQAFNDAVFAIVSTILVLPVRKLEETGASEHVSLEEQLKHRWPQFVIYMVGFLMMCAVWESHVLRFRILSRVDDVMIWFNLTSLLFTSCLPFTCALEGTFTSKGTPMALVCGNLITLEILEVIMIVYAFRQPRLLAQEFDTLTQDEMKQRMKLMLVKKAVIASLYLLAGLLSFLQKPLALVVAAVVAVSPWINRLVGVTYRKWSHIRLTDSEFDRMFGNFIDKERVEFFSDGVFAIVSTLLILDVTVEDFPTKAEVSSHGFVYTMQNVRPDISTYAVTFIVVALLWFTHHSLFNYIHTLNQVMLILNNLSLAFLGLFPLINATLDRYAGRGKPDSRLALQAAASIVFMAGISQGLVFIIAIWKGPTDPESQENPREDPRFGCTAHSYLAFKLATIPIMTLIVYFWATFGPNTSFSVDVYYIAGGLTPVLFILLKFVLSCLQRVHYRRSFQIREENWTIVTHDLESEDYPRVV